MRFSVALPCFFGGMDFCEAIKTVKKCGFDAAEIYDYTKLDLERAADTLLTEGVELVSLCTTDFRMNEPEHSSEWLDGVYRSCLAANKLGAKRMITQVGKDSGLYREYQRAAIVDNIRLAEPILKECGVTLMIEPLNVLVNHPGYFMPSSEEAFSIIKESGAEHTRVVYDIYHQQVSEGNILPTIKNNLSLISHLHAAAHPGRIDLWLGENDYGFIFDRIDELGYDGLCGLEYRPTLPAIESLRRIRELYCK